MTRAEGKLQFSSPPRDTGLLYYSLCIKLFVLVYPWSALHGITLNPRHQVVSGILSNSIYNLPCNVILQMKPLGHDIFLTFLSFVTARPMQGGHALQGEET